MMYLVHMKVNIPQDIPADVKNDLVEQEQQYSQQAQRDGKITALWRVAGRYANYCVVDVPSNDELHALLAGLPLFPHLDIEVTPLCKHPNAIR